MVHKHVVAIPRDNRKLAAAHHPTSSDEARWRIVLAHTPTSEFLYAVLSTGIYCRTSCPSRRPRRANVRFFDSPSNAVAAGFRACRRCRPESTDSSHASPRTAAEKQIEVACEYIQQRKGKVQLLDIAAHVGLSPRYFHGLFKQILGTTPGAYAATVRREGSTPATTVRDPTPLAVDFGHANGAAQLGTVGDRACDLSFVDSSHTADYWLSGCLEGADAMYTDQGPYSEWLGDCDLDITQFLELDNGTLGRLTGTCAPVPDFVDPSLLRS